MKFDVGDIVQVNNARLRVIGISGDRIHLEREHTKESIGWWNISNFKISRCN